MLGLLLCFASGGRQRWRLSGGTLSGAGRLEEKEQAGSGGLGDDGGEEHANESYRPKAHHRGKARSSHPW
jgi:hypothetical protein